MLYRKLYLWALLDFVLSFIPYVNLVAWVAFGITANYIYYKHSKKKLLEIKMVQQSPEMQRNVAIITGGTNNVPVVIGIIIAIIAVIGILAAIAIPAYIGMQEKAKKGVITRAISSATPELQAWLNSSLKGKDSGLREVREQDTDGNGVINDEDLTNSELLNKGVCTQYVMMKTSVGKEKSSWDVNTDLWSINVGNGQIQCMQSADNSITLIAYDKNGSVIDTKTVTAE